MFNVYVYYKGELVIIESTVSKVTAMRTMDLMFMEFDFDRNVTFQWGC